MFIKNVDRKEITKAIADLIFPARCPVCDRAMKYNKGVICRKCSGVIKYAQEPFCMKCGKPLDTQEAEYCYDCMQRKHIFVKGRAVFEYHCMAESIYRFKYKGRREYAEFYGKAMAERLGREIGGWKPQAFIPVPIHASRMRSRGYNQAEAIAEALGNKLGIPVRTDIIKRYRKTAPQKNLNHGERQNNLKKAFKILRNDVKLDTIVIIDDIYTTGSTVDAVAKELRKTGITNIYYVALAVGKGI